MLSVKGCMEMVCPAVHLHGLCVKEMEGERWWVSCD